MYPPPFTASAGSAWFALHASDYGKSVEFYTAVYNALGAKAQTVPNDTPTTEFGLGLFVRNEKPATSNAEIIINAATAAQVDAAWKAGGGNCTKPHEIPASGGNPAQYVGQLKDPDGNLVWIVFTARHV